MSVADSIRNLRKERGWSQVRLAMEAHVSQQAISFIERERNEPSAEMIRALAKAFGVSTAEILGEKVQDNHISNMEDQLLAVFRQLNDAGKNSLLALAESMLQQSTFRQDGSVSSAI